MTKREAARLRRWAARRRPDGSRGPRARLALRRMIRAADAGAPAAVDAVWHLWLQAPDDALWEHLTRWQATAAFGDAALWAAVDTQRPAASRAAIGEFCARHGFVVEDRIRRALFHVLTGQGDQHRALDPDGSLLAAAYRSADEATRAALRTAVTGDGDLNLARVLVGADRPGRDLTGEETAYLAARLAEREDWDGLWRLVRDAPIGHAVAAMPLFTDWRPPDESGRHLFRRLAAARPQVAAASAMLRAAAATRIPLESYGYGPGVLSFSPDLSQVAITASRTWVDVFALPGGRQVSRIPTEDMPDGALHLGDGLLVTERRSGYHEDTWRLLRHADGERTTLWEGTRPPTTFVSPLIRHMARTRDGFVAQVADHLAFGTADASTLRLVPPGDFAPFAGGREVCLLAVDPVSGRLALHDRHTYGITILDADLRVVARCESEWSYLAPAVFIGPDRLVTAGREVAVLRDPHGEPTLLQGRSDVDLVLWRQAGQNLVVDGRLANRRLADRRLHFASPVTLPLTGQLAVVTEKRWYSSEMTVTYLDAETLAETAAPPHVPDAPAFDVWSSPNGEYLGLVTDEADDPADRAPCLWIHGMRLNEVVALIGRPVARMRPGDLATVAAAERADVHPEITALLALLRASLEHRFAGEITLGTTLPSTGDPHDIAIAPPDGRT